jgi:hypothetical protein
MERSISLKPFIFRLELSNKACFLLFYPQCFLSCRNARGAQAGWENFFSPAATFKHTGHNGRFACPREQAEVKYVYVFVCSSFVCVVCAAAALLFCVCVCVCVCACVCVAYVHIRVLCARVSMCMRMRMHMRMCVYTH